MLKQGKTRKPSRRRHNQSRKQRGGLGNFIRFQYTKREERGVWAETLYPYANAFLNALKEFPWDSYNYEGPADVIIMGTAKNIERIIPISEKIKKTLSTDKWNPSEFRYVTPIRITGANKIPYKIFGGAACELWNKVYPLAGKLHDTTDPTADIDITLNPPKFEMITPPSGLNEEEELLIRLMKDKNERPRWKPSNLARLTRRNRRAAMAIARAYTPYTPFAEHYTRWLFDRTVDLARKVARYIPANRFHAPSKEDTPETSIADLVETVGPFLVSRLYKNDIIKIQITTQIKIPPKRPNDPVYTYTDHCLEMLINTDKPTQSGDNNRNTTLLDGLYVEGIYDLIYSQISGLKARLELIKEVENAKKAGQNVPELSHKLINHYGRLLYLGKLFKYAQIHKSMKLMSFQGEATIRSLMEYASLFEPQEGREAYPPPNGFSPEEYRKPFEELLEYRKEEKRGENAAWKARVEAAQAARRAAAAAAGENPAASATAENEEENSNTTPRGPPILTPGARFLQMLGLRKGAA